MRIALIKPGMGPIIEGYNIDGGRMEPLQLAILASLVKKKDEVHLYDDRMEVVPFKERFDLVGITVDSFTARRAYEISRKFRRTGAKVVLGGVHPTLLPQEAGKNADSVVLGDAEPVFGQLIEDVRENKLRSTYKAEFTTPQKGGLLPRRDLLKGKGYLPMSLVQFSRGCRMDCSFCSVSKFFQRSHNCRDPKDVVREIKAQGLKHILFVDDNLVSDRERAKELLRLLVPLKVKWASQSSIDMVKDPELMELMKRSGCVGHLVGFESIDVNTLKWLNKRINAKKFDGYEAALKVLRDTGFQIWGSFMIGNDLDDRNSIRRTVDFAIKKKLALAWFHILMPYPGTEVYERFKKEKRLLYGGHWWDHPDFRYNTATFKPKLMTPKELADAAVEANRRFYGLSSIARRFLDTKTHMRNPTRMWIYSRLNYILRSTSI